MSRTGFPAAGRLLAAALAVVLWAVAPAQAVERTSLPSLKDLAYLTDDAAAARKKALTQPLDYAWDVFFLASWPALPGAEGRGKPDPDKTVGQTGGPTLWQSWKGDEEVYLPDGKPPGAWASAYPTPPGGPQTSLPPASSGDLWTPLTGNVQVSGFDLKGPDGQPILYHIRLNRPTYDYVTRHELYSIDGQIAFATSAGPAEFGWRAMEAKAAWRVLDPERDADQIPRYYTSHAYYAERDDAGHVTGWNKVLVGLTGLHLITKAIDRWVWITYEQIDNEEWTGVRRVNPIPQDVQRSNRVVQRLLAGTPWQFYELVGIQTGWGRKADPTLLANTQIESLFQSRSSCMTCHSVANVKTTAVTPEKSLRFPFVDTSGGSPPYYVGPGPKLPEGYVSLDFVFSLYRAEFSKP